ncbi:MAG: glycosyltransferase family 39 protein, partial [Elusimicrobia bacterium]|nr:glycosyltransferase family 39 protein [Elusimicrobiota bacterium]
MKAFILAGSFFFFGISPFVLRATTLLTGAAALLFLVLFAARRFGAAWGAAFALLVVADPAFVTAVVYDTGPVAVSLALKSLALWLLASSEESPRAWPRRLAAGVALGMCVWDKSHSLWLLLAAPAAAWLLPRGKRAEAGAQIFAGALIGAAPWLIYNAVNPFITFRDPGNQGWTLAAHFGRIVYWLGMRLGLLAAALTGRGSLTMVAGEPMSPALAPALLVSTFLGASAFLVWRRGPGSREGLTEAGRWLGLSTAIFGFALLSPVPVKWHHLMLLWPFPQFALIAILRGLPVSRRSRSVRISVVALCLLPAAFDLGALNAFRNETIRDRGGRMFAEAVRDAAAWIGAREASRPGTVVLCGYALAAPVAVYSAGRAVCSDADPEFLSHLQTAAPQMAAGDLLWTSPVMDYGGWQGESAALVELNERIPHERAAVFLDAANRPLVEIFRSASRDARSLREDLAAVHASVPASRSREDADVLPA